MYKQLFQKCKSLLPRISETELLALKSGTASLDRQIFEGKVVYPKKKEIIPYFQDDTKINGLLEKYGQIKNVYPDGPYKQIFDYIAREKFFSFIIPEKYGGIPLSVSELSSILCKVSSRNPSLGVSIMVPNSLGPAELLEHYGTQEQKEHYLPKLAYGDYIPCFGLTGPHNGSDATGSIDTGTVIFKENEKFINLTINKRYITLGPIANLIGIAFNLEDPYELLDKGSPGITVALIENTHPGLQQSTHHNPLNVGFPNGTLKGNLTIPVENIIGGEKNAGQGWKMLMECLAAGRGICLPATAKASSNTAMVGITEYAKHRKQFKIPLIRMEGIQHKMVNMLYHTWAIHCSVALTNHLLDSGEKPAVISAIMKQQTTDRARDVLNDAMDIHAGSAICLGHNNFLEKFYRAAPIGITVEGSNTLTKNLIIFGQGLNKSHPHIFPIFDALLTNNMSEFEIHFKHIINHTISSYFKSMIGYQCKNNLEKQTLHFANLANFVALKGGKLKSEQMLSSDMADILSNLYLAHSIQWYHQEYNISKKVTDYCIARLVHDNQVIINRVLDNEWYLRTALFYLRKKPIIPKYSDAKIMINELENNRYLMEDLKKDILLEETGIDRLIKLSTMKTDSDEYKELYNKVIQVGEYKNP
jgi:acyl-CoA dehydrogenase